jgi:SAM-dependent methyltransferase
MPRSAGSTTAAFWDRRYAAEGAVWGESPSPTALLALGHLSAGARILEVGFGYGRDLVFFARRGFRVVGVDPSDEGCRQAGRRLADAELAVERLVTGTFEEVAPSLGLFDAVVSHRVAHLLQGDDDVRRFVAAVKSVLRPGGLAVVGARNDKGLDPRQVVERGGNVYELRSRPGHCIRYWGEGAFMRAFGADFDVLAMTEVVDEESASNRVPCPLTLMAGALRGGGAP